MSAAEDVLRVFTQLFNGGPDTACRTVWDHSEADFRLGIGPLECVSVPMEDLGRAFDEAVDIIAGTS
jgi:hypothetical protein